MLSPRIRAGFFYTGIGLLVLSAGTLAGELTGLLSLPETLLMGESRIHTVVRFAVAGCVLAAIGSWE